jgi:hypothetical protein
MCIKEVDFLKKNKNKNPLPNVALEGDQVE